jgi:thioredoxin reductase/Pyruvate/2-oxoacid:ferredoxin oxidoreductase delta subunit
MFWLPWILPCLLIGLVITALLHRRSELRSHATVLDERQQAHRRGSAKAELQHPVIDLTKCFGCGACVRACPEEGVLGLAYGQAVVVHGARCVSHARCVDVCPSGAIALTLADAGERRDLPAVDDRLQAVGVPGLWLAGELTGFALVRTAILHGTQVAHEVARTAAAARRARRPVRRHAWRRNGRGGAALAELDADDDLDLLIVGMGPAGLACALASKERGLRFHCLEQLPHIGGTVAGYPRRKLVMTQPVDLPLYGRMKLSWYKEELVELWQELTARHELPVSLGQTLIAVQRDGDGGFVVRTADTEFRARNVCLALGRRGAPNRLEVPGEELPKVSYGLLDADSYAGRRVLVVGGGDSAVEAALALAEQPGTQVTLSYRRDAFFRLKAQNERRIAAAVADGRVDARMGSTVARIEPDAVVLRAPGPNGRARTATLPNDDVFVMAGGTPPFALLEQAGVSFDPALRPPPPVVVERGNGVLTAFAIAFCGSLLLLAFGLVHRDYYGAASPLRTAHPDHARLRPQGTVGLAAGVLACGLFVLNLGYLVRRSRFGRWLPGSLNVWMNAHVATGLMSLLLVCLHCGFHARDSVAGHALLVLCVVVSAGAVGRWLYSFVPRQLNGRQTDLEELAARMAAISGEWDSVRGGFGATVRQRIDRLVSAGNWRRGFVRRLFGLVTGQLRLWLDLRRLRRVGRRSGVPVATTRRVLSLARRAHRLSLQLVHFDELRGLLSTWRWVHRWLSLLLVILTVMHVWSAVRFSAVDFSALPAWLGGRR